MRQPKRQNSTTRGRTREGDQNPSELQFSDSSESNKSAQALNTLEIKKRELQKIIPWDACGMPR